MRIVDADAFEKYAWSNPDIEVDGEPYISPSAVQNFAMDHPIEITPPNEPLRLEQLREMDGMPSWLADGRCYIVNQHHPQFSRPVGIDKYGQATDLELLTDVGLYCRPPEGASEQHD